MKINKQRPLKRLSSLLPGANHLFNTGRKTGLSKRKLQYIYRSDDMLHRLLTSFTVYSVYVSSQKILLSNSFFDFASYRNLSSSNIRKTGVELFKVSTTLIVILLVVNNRSTECSLLPRSTEVIPSSFRELAPKRGSI